MLLAAVCRRATAPRSNGMISHHKPLGLDASTPKSEYPVEAPGKHSMVVRSRDEWGRKRME